MSTPSPLDTGALLADRYQLDHPIASGGFGDVWRGTDVILARPVAIKLLRAEFAADPATLARFRDEAQHASALEHENVVRIYDYDELATERLPFLVMEYIDGPSLGEMLSGGPLEPALALDILGQAAAGLHAAHEAGLVHRDIKPQNVLLTSTGQVKLTDFGIARAVEAAPLTMPGTLFGTPEYLAPERAAGGRGTQATDLYALGILAFQCLDGAPPFTGSPVEVAMAHRDEPMPPLPPDVPDEVAALVRRLTAKDPADRPASAAQVAAEARVLRAWLPGSDVGRAGFGAGGYGTAGGDLETVLPPVPPGAGFPRPATSPMPLPRRRRSRGLLLAGAAAALAALAAVAVIVLRGTGLNHPAVASAKAVMVDVHAARLRGQPVGSVRRMLTREGLVVHVRWRPTTRMAPGLVLGVRPGGRMASGSAVTILGSEQPGSTQPPPGYRHRHGKRHHARHGHHTTGASPGPTATPGPTGTPTPTSTPTPSPTATPTPTPTGSPGPTTSPGPSGSPSPGPTGQVSSPAFPAP